MEEKFSLPVTTFLRQLLKTEAASRQQFLTSVLLCSVNLQQGSGLLSQRAALRNIHYRSGLCMGSYYTASLLLLLHLHTHSLAKTAKAFYQMQSENEETESELEFTEVNHLQCKQIYQCSNLGISLFLEGFGVFFSVISLGVFLFVVLGFVWWS